MTQNTQSSAEIDREIFFLCFALINKKKNTDGETIWRHEPQVERWHTHILQMVSNGFHMRQWVKRSWISTGKEKEEKIVWLIFLSLARNRMRNKQEAAEECRVQKHLIILDTTKLQEKGIWRVIKMLAGRNLMASLMTISVLTAKGFPHFLATKATFCGLF